MKPVVVITGANSGIGAAAAARMLEHGWTVVTTARDPSKISLSGPGVHKLALDVTSDESVRAFAKELAALNLEGPLSVVNNAGLAVAGPVEGVPMADWEKQIQTNVLGVVRVLQALLPRIRETRGRVVNIGSVSGRMASPFLGPYATSKFALRAMNDSLRRELRPLGVHVVLIEPGPIKTPIWERSKDDGLKLRDSLSADLAAVYSEGIGIFLETAMQAAATAVPVDAAADAIERALLDENPQAYFSTSVGHYVQSALGNLIPAKMLDRLIGSALRLGRKD